MTTVFEAIYTNGQFTPVESLNLPEQQRVRLVMQTIDRPSEEDRQAAINRFVAGVEAMDFHLSGPLPTRDELHERL